MPKSIGLLSITTLVLLCSTCLSEAKKYKHPTIHEARMPLKLPLADIPDFELPDANGNAAIKKDYPVPVPVKTVIYLSPVPVIPVTVEDLQPIKATYGILPVTGGAFSALLVAWLMFNPRRKKNVYKWASERSNRLVQVIRQHYAKTRIQLDEQDSSKGNEQPVVYPWKERVNQRGAWNSGDGAILGRYGVGHPSDSALAVWSRSLRP